MLDRMTHVLRSVSAAVAIVPGIVVLANGLGSPPGSRGIFAVALEIVGAGTLVAVLLRKDVPQRPSPVQGTLAALLLIAAYFVAFDTAVERHGYYPGTETSILIPFGTPWWAPPQLDTLVACAQRPCPSVMPDYSAADVARAVTRYGPDEVLPLIPPWYRRATILALFALYAGCIATLVATFGFWARRVAAAPAEEPQSTTVAGTA